MPEYTEKVENSIEVLPPFNTIKCTQHTIVLRDGEEVGRTTSYIVREPDGGTYPNDPQEVQAIASVLHTDAVQQAWANSQSPLPDNPLPPL